MQLQIECNKSTLMQQICMLCHQRFELKEARVIVCSDWGKAHGDVCPQCIAMGPEQLWKSIFANQVEFCGNTQYCTLKWRQDKLIVGLSAQPQQPYMPVISNQERLVNCLRSSTVSVITLTPDLGEAKLKLWAEACSIAGKATFLRIPNTLELPQKQAGVGWGLKRLIDFITAALLLMIVSPVMLGLAMVIRQQSLGPIFQSQWCVGERGRLFKIFKFRNTVVDTEQWPHQIRDNPLGRWLRRSNLDMLPQLFNVLRGEISLVGPRPWTLDEATCLKSDQQRRLNALPGIISPWRVRKEFRSSGVQEFRI